MTFEETLKGLPSAAQYQLDILERKDQLLLLRKRGYKPFLDKVDYWTRVKEQSEALVNTLYAAQSEALSVGNNEQAKEDCDSSNCQFWSHIYNMCLRCNKG